MMVTYVFSASLPDRGVEVESHHGTEKDAILAAWNFHDEYDLDERVWSVVYTVKWYECEDFAFETMMTDCNCTVRTMRIPKDVFMKYVRKTIRKDGLFRMEGIEGDQGKLRIVKKK